MGITAIEVFCMLVSCVIGLAQTSSAVLVSSGAPTGVTYCVSPTGSDSAPGTAQSPFATIQKAADSVSPGDTVQIAAGIYHERVALTRSGAYWGREIRFEGAGPDKTIIDAKDLPGWAPGVFDTASQDYLVISGIGVENSNSAGFSIRQSWQVALTNCRSFNTTDSGVKIDKSGIVRMTGCEVERACQGRGEESVSVKRSQDVQVRDCSIHDTGHEGLDVKEGSKDVLVIGCTISHAERQGLYAEAWDSPTSNIRFENNIVHDCGFGVAAGSECGGLLSGVWFVNNLIYNNNGPGMISADWGDARFDHPVRDLHFVNNTVVNNGRKPSGWDGGMVFENTQIQSIEVANNILVDNGSEQMRVTANKRPMEWDIHDNLVFGPGQPMGTRTVVADPRFVDPDRQNYDLKPGSPAMAANIGWRPPQKPGKSPSSP